MRTVPLSIYRPQQNRLAYNIAAADNDNVLALQLNAIVRQSCHAGTRSTGSKTAAAHEHITDILRIQAVYVLVRRNCRAHVIAVDMLRHRHHRHNTGNVTVTVQLFDDADNLLLRSIGRAGDNFFCKAVKSTLFFADSIKALLGLWTFVVKIGSFSEPILP